jgi:hypothetical protein
MTREVDGGSVSGAVAHGGGGRARPGMAEGGRKGRWAGPAGGQGLGRSGLIGLEARSSGQIRKKKENQFENDFELSKALENHKRRI